MRIQRLTLTFALLIAAGVPVPVASSPAIQRSELAAAENHLAIPTIGEHHLRIITPTLLELSLVTTTVPDGRVSVWDFVADDGTLHVPDANAFKVTARGTKVAVQKVGFKRRVVYAPLKKRDLRIGNWLYLWLAAPA